MAQTKTSPRRGPSKPSGSRSSTRASSSRSAGRSSSNGSATRSRSSARKRNGSATGRGSSTRKRPNARAGGGTRTRSNTRARSTRRAGSTHSGSGRSAFESVTDTVSSGAQNAAQAVGGVVKKSKTPLIAGGAAIAGVAGAAALNARSRRRNRKVLGVTIPRRNGLKNVDARKIAGAVTDAAKRADRFGQRVSSVANSVQTVSETADRASKRA
jgi:hypothetical protein